MMLLRHYCTIKRQTAVGTNGRKQLSTHASRLYALIAGADPRQLEFGFALWTGTWCAR
jgi:hypothetical protein